MVPPDPVITSADGGADAFDLPVAALAGLPRRELTADFHCVAGWSATGLRWEGVTFEDLLPLDRRTGARTRHGGHPRGVRGLDGYRSVLLAEDALDDGVLLAQHLDGRPLGADHGAPVRLVSPAQYGYVSTKHLCRIEVHTGEPRRRSLVATRLLEPHPRARVRQEERHGTLPGWLVRPVYRASVTPLVRLSAKGGDGTGTPPR